MKLGPEVVKAEVRMGQVTCAFSSILLVFTTPERCMHAAMRCFLCQADVAACPRRVVSPSKTEEAGTVRLSFFNIFGVWPACANEVVYACKSCFRKMERIEKQRQVLERSVAEVKSLAEASGISPATSICVSATPVTTPVNVSAVNTYACIVML